jgi:hypothetical protein
MALLLALYIHMRSYMAAKTRNKLVAKRFGLYLWYLVMYGQNSTEFHCLQLCLRGHPANGSIHDVDRPTQTPETRDGDRQTESSCHSRFRTAISCFRCRTMSASVVDESIETGSPENMGIAFGISILSVLERELQLLPVWRPPSCVSGIP